MRHTARAAHRLPQCGKQERDKLRKAGTRFPAGSGAGTRPPNTRGEPRTGRKSRKTANRLKGRDAKQGG